MSNSPAIGVIFWTFVCIAVASGLVYFFRTRRQDAFDATYKVPVTPHEKTHAAQEMVDLAASLYENAYNIAADGQKQLEYLAKANQALNLARSYDPSVPVSLMDDDDKQSHDVTQDKFAGILHFAEARKYMAETEAFNQSMDNEDASFPFFEMKTAYKNSFAAMVKAIRYDPHNAIYWHYLALIHANNGKLSLALKAAERARHYDPKNIDTLKLIQQLRP
jgi:tetratricopeptide (TPR) repeat protein